MDYAFLLVPIAVFAFFAVLIWRMIGGLSRRADELARQQQELDRRRAQALGSTARVLASDPRPDEIRDQHGFGVYRVLILSLEVSTPGSAGGVGGDSYTAEAKWDVQVTALPHVAPGATIGVLVDREDPQRVYPTEAWARSTVE